MNSENKVVKETKSGWKVRMRLAIIIVAIYIIFNIFGAGCPIKFLTGISCPGCGMTRAILAAIRLQFNEAFYFHPLFGLVPFMFALYLFEDYLKPIHVKYIWIVILVLFLVVYFLRLFIFKNDIVSIDIYNSSVIRFIQTINILGGER